MVRGKFYFEVDVYSLNTNSWRRKDTLVLGTIVENFISKCFLNGALHWRGATTGVRNLIISCMSSTRDNSRTPIKRALQVCQALLINSKKNNILDIKSPN